MPSVLKWMSRRMKKKKPLEMILKEQSSESPEDIISEFDVPYVSEEGVSLHMDIYRPAAAGTEPLPVIILVHGGGMMIGSPRMEKGVCELLARKGFLVFAPAYRLITEADGFGELCDVTAGFDYISRKLEEYGGDPDRVYLIGESAGAWLSLYAYAMIHSETIRNLMPFAPADIRFKGMIFISGMFYTLKKDPIGLVYPRDLYGDRRKDRSFTEYMNPENEEVLKCLPPVILTSSKADYLRRYTLDYAKALHRAGHKCKMIYFPEKNKELIHAFVTRRPDLPESKVALDKICEMMLS